MPGKPATKRQHQDNAANHEHDQDQQRRQPRDAVSAEERTTVGDHHRPGEEKHRQQADQPVDENGGHGLGFLVMRFPRGVVGLHQIAAGGTEQEGIEKMGDQGNLRSAAKGQLQALHGQDHPPPHDAQQQRRRHQEQREGEQAPMNAGDRADQGFGAFLPAEFPLFDAREAGPARRVPNAGFVDEDGVKNPEQQHRTERQPPADLPEPLHPRDKFGSVRTPSPALPLNLTLTLSLTLNLTPTLTLTLTPTPTLTLTPTPTLTLTPTPTPTLTRNSFVTNGLRLRVRVRVRFVESLDLQLWTHIGTMNLVVAPDSDPARREVVSIEP